MIATQRVQLVLQDCRTTVSVSTAVRNRQCIPDTECTIVIACTSPDSAVFMELTGGLVLTAESNDCAAELLLLLLQLTG